MDMNVSLMVYNHRWGYEDMSGIYGLLMELVIVSWVDTRDNNGNLYH